MAHESVIGRTMNENAQSPPPPSSRADKHRLLRWKRDIILASSPATTRNGDDFPLHLIVLATLKLHRHLPRLAASAKIDTHGAVHTVMLTSEEPLEGRKVRLGQVNHIRDGLRRLADHCKLDDADRQAMFDAFSGWIAKDERANDPHKQRVQ